MPKYLVPRDELPYNPSDRQSIIDYAYLLEGHTLQEACDIDSHEAHETKKGNKGGLGQAVEYYYFKYEPNSDQEPDFPEVGMELKTTPIKRNKNKSISAKERLVLTMIDYFKVVDETWETLTCLEKMRDILLISYLHEPAKNVFDYEIEYARPQDFPAEDMAVIQDDWETIVEKVRQGRAHELSGGDTHYLEACTKSANSSKRRPQPFSDILAKPRAFALKSSYMTAFYNKNLGLEAIRRIRGEESLSLEDLVKSRFAKYKGMTATAIMEALGRVSSAKSKYALVTKAILGIEDDNDIAEFAKAGIISKTIRIEESDVIEQHISFPSFEFSELLEEDDWDSSEFCRICESEFFFVVFKKHEEDYLFAGCDFWRMPAPDREKARETWEETHRVVQEGVLLSPRVNKAGKVQLCKDGNPVLDNNLPGPAFNGVAHVRPHTSQRAYRLEDGTEIGNVAAHASELPDGRAMTKQSFWLDKSYIREQLRGLGL